MAGFLILQRYVLKRWVGAWSEQILYLFMKYEKPNQMVFSVDKTKIMLISTPKKNALKHKVVDKI